MSGAGATLNATWAAALVDGLVRAGGIRHAVMSPGSRSTPLVLALYERDDVTLHTVLDERSAAFFALGAARASGQPALLVCTSGSAGGHWLPAVIEASAAGLPLILLTADRPPELHGCGAPQTVPQRELFAGHVRWSVDPGAPADGVDARWLRSLAALVVDHATGARPGPVHLNLPYRKPLWAPDSAAARPAPAARVIRGLPRLDDERVRSLAAELGAVERGAIVVGPLDGPPPTALLGLARWLGWPVIADVASQLRFHAHADRGLIAVGDVLARSGWAPAADLVLRVGRTPTSKALAAWLRTAGEVVLVDASGGWHDPDHVATRLLVCDPAQLAVDLVAELPGAPRSVHWLQLWTEAAGQAGDALASSCLGASALWSGTVVATLIARLPDGATLHLASSMAVRDVDAFAPRTKRAIRVTTNRGANGIDGTLATAFGQAAAGMGSRGGSHAVLCGDLAFQHDVASLRLARLVEGCALTIVCVDNGGGGIFGYLPIAAHPDAFEALFLTPQGSAANGRSAIEAACAAAEVRYRRCASSEALATALVDELERPGVGVLHVVVDREADARAHEAAWRAVAEVVGASWPAAEVTR